MRRIDRMGKMITKAIAVALSFSIIFGQTIGAHADELNTATALYEEGIELVETAEEEVNGADFEEIEAADMTNTDSELTAYGDAAQDLEVAAESAKENATTANTSDSRDEAYAAKDNAESSLTEAETKLNESLTALENAQAAYAEADAAQQEAEAAYAEAEAALTDTEADTAAAREALEAAKQAIEVQEAKKNDLEKIEAQYYGELVYFFYLTVGEKNIVFDNEGRLDVEKTTAKMTDAQIANAGNKDDEFLFRFGRKLTKELVEYMILNREDVDPETAEFTFGTTGTITTEKTAQEAVVFTNEHGHDMVVNKEPNAFKRDISQNEVYGGATEKYLWGTTNYNKGRGNHTEVTYKDVSGNLHTEYYNYVRKNVSENDVPDFENGNLYLAVITQGADGKWYPARVEDENNYDDYSKLTAAIDALNQIEDYNKAREDVEAALARVEALEATLASLTESATATKANLELVRTALNAAKEDLVEAEANKENLQAAYEEAKAAVESIDLSRFNIVVVPAPAANETPATEPVVEPVVETPAVITILPEETPLAPVLAAPAGEEEEVVDEVTAVVAIGEEETPLTEAVQAATAPEVATEVAAVIGTTQLIATIDGEIVPLAGFAFAESIKKVWWIWILIAATAITMYIIYKKNSEDEETETH